MKLVARFGLISAYWVVVTSAAVGRCMFYTTITSKASDTSMAIAFGITITSPFLYMALSKCVAELRGEMFAVVANLPLPEPNAASTVRKWTFPSLVGANYDQDRTVREHYEAFLVRLSELHRSWPFKALFQFDDEVITLMFFKTLTDDIWAEWKDTMAEQYCIGGIGCGPRLEIFDLVWRAEQDERLPLWRAAHRPGLLPKWCRLCLRLFCFVVYPTVATGLVVTRLYL